MFAGNFIHEIYSSIEQATRARTHLPAQPPARTHTHARTHAHNTANTDTLQHWGEQRKKKTPESDTKFPKLEISS